MALGELRRVVPERHDYAKDWKARTGKQVFVHLCCYAPEELVYAAGILPVRVWGAHEPQDITAPHIFSGMFCPFCRNCLAEGLKGSFDYAEGIFMGQSCSHIRHAFDSWRWHLPSSYAYFTSMPALVEHPAAKKFLVGEFSQFRKSLEDYVGHAISDADIEHATDVYNTNRRLLRQVYELRKADPPPISGAEVMEVVQSTMVMDKAESNRLLEELLKELPQRQDGPSSGSRLMMVGGENDDVDVLRVVEEVGANIVTDDLCFGTRYFWNEAIPQGDPITTLAARYLDKPSCPTKDISYDRRKRLLLDMVKDYEAQGVFFVMQKFCDPHEFHIPPLQKLCDQNNIPHFFFELDTTLPQGQLRTRAEAFLEMLELELV